MGSCSGWATTGRKTPSRPIRRASSCCTPSATADLPLAGSEPVTKTTGVMAQTISGQAHGRIADRDLVTRRQLAPAPGLDLAVYAYEAFGEQRLGLAPGVDEPRGLEQLAEPDHPVPCVKVLQGHHHDGHGAPPPALLRRRRRGVALPPRGGASAHVPA